MIYGSVDEKATRVKKAHLIVKKYEIIGATPDGNIITNFDAEKFDSKFSIFKNQQQGLWGGSCKYWKPTSLRVFRLMLNPNFASMVLYYSFSENNYYRYSTLLNVQVSDFIAQASDWGVTINSNNFTAGKDVWIPVESEVTFSEKIHLKKMYGSSGGRTKTIYK